MIRLLEPGREPLPPAICADPVLGPPMWADWQLCARLPGMPLHFYGADGAVVWVEGPQAILCGELADSEELAAFLRAQGVRHLTCRAQQRGVKTQILWGMVCTGPGSFQKLPLPGGYEAEPPPGEVVALLEQAGGPMHPLLRDGLYLRLAARRNHGFAHTVGFRQEGILVSTATLVQAPFAAQLAEVATLPGRQGQGLAGGLVAELLTLARTQVTLVCRPALAGFYERLGFIKEGSDIFAAAIF